MAACRLAICADPRHLPVMTMLRTFITRTLPSGLLLLAVSGGALACDAPAPVCDWTERVVGIRTPNMIASGTLVSDGVIITNRHVVEDHASVLTRDHAGSLNKAVPVPHDVPVDLATMNFAAGRARLSRFPRWPTGCRRPSMLSVSTRGGMRRASMRLRPSRFTPRRMLRCRHGSIQTPARFPATVAVP